MFRGPETQASAGCLDRLAGLERRARGMLGCWWLQGSGFRVWGLGL